MFRKVAVRARGAAFLTLACLTAAGFGCSSSSSTAELRGLVSINGSPVESGRIAFTPLDPEQGQAVGGPITRGAYRVRNVPLGKVRVSFNATRATGKMIAAYSTPIPEVVNIIPRKYQSGLEIQVTSGSKEQSFDLTD